MDDLRFTPFSTGFQSFQDDAMLIMKECCSWLRRFRLERGSNLVRWISRPALNPLSYWGSFSDENNLEINEMIIFELFHTFLKTQFLST